MRSFIGLVNHYRDMWGKRSETLAPLTALTSIKVKVALRSRLTLILSQNIDVLPTAYSRIYRRSRIVNIGLDKTCFFKKCLTDSF